MVLVVGVPGWNAAQVVVEESRLDHVSAIIHHPDTAAMIVVQENRDHLSNQRLVIAFNAKVQICSLSGQNGPRVTRNAAVALASGNVLAPVPCLMATVKTAACVAH